MFGNIALLNSLDKTYIFWYVGFIFLSIYALTDLMDRNVSAFAWETLRSGIGLAFLYQQNDWFGAAIYFSSIINIIGVYFILCIIITGLLVMKHRKEDQAFLIQA